MSKAPKKKPSDFLACFNIDKHVASEKYKSTWLDILDTTSKQLKRKHISLSIADSSWGETYDIPKIPYDEAVNLINMLCSAWEEMPEIDKRQVLEFILNAVGNQTKH